MNNPVRTTFSITGQKAFVSEIDNLDNIEIAWDYAMEEKERYTLVTETVFPRFDSKLNILNNLLNLNDLQILRLYLEFLFYEVDFSEGYIDVDNKFNSFVSDRKFYYPDLITQVKSLMGKLKAVGINLTTLFGHFIINSQNIMLYDYSSLTYIVGWTNYLHDRSTLANSFNYLRLTENYTASLI